MSDDSPGVMFGELVFALCCSGSLLLLALRQLRRRPPRSGRLPEAGMGMGMGSAAGAGTGIGIPVSDARDRDAREREAREREARESEARGREARAREVRAKEAQRERREAHVISHRTGERFIRI